MRKIILLVCLFVLFGAEMIESSSASNHLCFIRIDQYNRIWYNMRMATPDNLPKLISNNLQDSLLRNDYFVYEKLSVLLEDYLENKRALLRIIVHPKSHYMIFNNILFMYNKIELPKNKEIAKKKNIDINVIEKYMVRYSILEWGSRDDRIIQAAYENAELKENDSTLCTKEFQYDYKLKEGYWKDKIDEKKYYIYDSNNILNPKVPNPNADIE